MSEYAIKKPVKVEFIFYCISCNIPTKTKILSRRDFLKLGGAGLLTLLFPSSESLDDLTEAKKANIVEVETANAIYFPVYEDHTHPATKDDIEKLPKLNVYFYELLYNSSKLTQEDPTQLLNRDTSHTLQQAADSQNTNTRKYIFPRDHLEVFKKNNTEISLEGYMLPETEIFAYLGFKFTETVVGAVGAFAYLAAKKKHEIKETDKPLVSPKVDLAIKSTLAWLLSPIIETTVSNTLSYFGTDTELNAMQRIASRVLAMTNHAHPETNLIFFRNLLMSRKLQFLGEVLSGEHFSKPKIGYNVGMAHSEIEDFIRLSPDIVLALINAYPADYLRKIVELNGGLEAFCSTILLTPDTRHSEKIVVQDKRLRLVLEKKLSQTSKVGA